MAQSGAIMARPQNAQVAGWIVNGNVANIHDVVAFLEGQLWGSTLGEAMVRGYVYGNKTVRQRIALYRQYLEDYAKLGGAYFTTWHFSAWDQGENTYK